MEQDPSDLEVRRRRELRRQRSSQRRRKARAEWCRGRHARNDSRRMKATCHTLLGSWVSRDLPRDYHVEVTGD